MLGAGAGIIDRVVHQVGEAILVVLDALPQRAAALTRRLVRKMVLSPARAVELHDRGPAVRPDDGLLPHRRASDPLAVFPEPESLDRPGSPT